MTDTLRSEWLKLWSTRSPYACLLSVGAVTVAIAAAAGANAAAEGRPPAPDQVLAGLLGYGLIILMVMAALTVTSEYRTGTIRVTFTVIRGRTKVIAAKAVLMGVVSALTAAVLTPVAWFAAGAVAGRAMAMDAQAIRLAWGLPVVAAVAGVLAISVATLVRHSAGVVALVIIWPLLFEGLTTLIPRVGQNVATFLPFTNAHNFLGTPQGLPFAWSDSVSLVVFVAYAAVLASLAIWTLTTRDA